jgi:hypothetical protein
MFREPADGFCPVAAIGRAHCDRLVKLTRIYRQLHGIRYLSYDLTRSVEQIGSGDEYRLYACSSDS